MCSGRAVQYHFTEAADASVQQNLAEWIVALVTQVLIWGLCRRLSTSSLAVCNMSIPCLKTAR